MHLNILGTPLAALPALSHAIALHHAGPTLTDLPGVLDWMRVGSGSRWAGGMILAGLLIGTFRKSGMLWLDALLLGFALDNAAAFPAQHWHFLAGVLVVALMAWSAIFAVRSLFVLAGLARYCEAVAPAPVILAQWGGDALRALARRARIKARRAQRQGTLNPF